MTETYWCPGPWPWQWFRTCTREVPDPPFDPCQAPACVAALEKLAGARGRFASSCNGLRMINALVKLLKQVLAVPIWTLIVMAIIAIIVGGVLVVIIWALIAAYGISWVLVLVLGKMAESLVVSLEQARVDVISALKEVADNCPQACRGDTSMPACNLE